RHLCEVDWATTVSAGLRAIDDPLPFFLTDGRVAAAVERSDAIWTRIIDLPACFDARRSPVPGRAVLEVSDHLGFAAGRWSIELGPDAGSAELTDDPAELEMTVDVLSALYFGGHTPRRFADTGRIV